jgi:UDPglucose 6-dehydrogenase
MVFGIVGNGFVGQATKLLSSPENQCVVYDIDPAKCEPVGLALEDLKQCSIIFICVPTPSNSDGSCNVSIVESCVEKLLPVVNFDKTFVICRSTVIMGTCDSLGIYHMPEFLTEKNWKQDFLTCKTWIFGQPEENHVFQGCIKELIDSSPVSGELRNCKVCSQYFFGYQG